MTLSPTTYAVMPRRVPAVPGHPTLCAVAVAALPDPRRLMEHPDILSAFPLDLRVDDWVVLDPGSDGAFYELWTVSSVKPTVLYQHVGSLGLTDGAAARLSALLPPDVEVEPPVVDVSVEDERLMPFLVPNADPEPDASDFLPESFLIDEPGRDLLPIPGERPGDHRPVLFTPDPVSFAGPVDPDPTPHPGELSPPHGPPADGADPFPYEDLPGHGPDDDPVN